MANRTGYIFDELFMWHNTGMGALFIPPGGPVQPDIFHAENTATKRRIDALLEVSNLKSQMHSVANIEPLTREQMELYHTNEYLDRIKNMSDNGGGDAGEFTPFGQGSFEIAALSAGACLAGARAIQRGEIDNAYVLNRPPGHHAEADIGRGFCLLANGALAAMNLRREFGDMKIAFVDWDVHHGNGTQKAFYDDPSTLTISIHQYKNYPQESGYVEEAGEGTGEGYNINVPLPPGSGHGAYVETIQSVVAPAMDAFKPDFIIVLSGFDGCCFDPLGRNMAYSETYREMTKQMMAIAKKHCGGKLLVCHEGGYSAAYTPFCGLAVCESLTGIKTETVDPFIDIASGYGMQELQEHQDEAIKQSAQIIKQIK